MIVSKRFWKVKMQANLQSSRHMRAVFVTVLRNL